MRPRTTTARLRVLVALGAVASAGPALAQGCPQSALAVRVEGHILQLTAGTAERLPYGRPLTVLVRSEAPPPAAMTVTYRLTGGPDGERVGQIAAARAAATSPGAAPPDGARTCWAAALPPIRLNETGSIAAHTFRSPVIRAGRAISDFVGRLLTGTLAFPDVLTEEQYRQQAALVATAAAQDVFEGEPGALVLRRRDGTWVTLADTLAELLPRRLDIENIWGDVARDARQVAGLAGVLLERAPVLRDVTTSGCPAAPNLEALRARASALAEATPGAVLAQVAGGELPWPRCVVALVVAATQRAPAGAEGERLEALEQHVQALVTLPAAATVTAVAAGIEAVMSQAVQVRTLAVSPIAAELLERYTQVDVMSVWVPPTGLVQPFASATLYLSRPPGGRGWRFLQSVEPEGEERFGIQLGYPVGGAIREDDGTFVPSILAGLLVRANALLSFSVGGVFGRESDRSRTYGYFSTNLDLSNLGPLQDILARRDQ